MKQDKLRIIIVVEVLALLGIVFGILSLERGVSSTYRLFELLGVVSASLITTFGLYKMRDLT